MYSCHMGYWEEHLSFSPLPEDEQAFTSLGSLAILVEDRTVLLAPDPDGKSPYSIDRDKNGGRGLSCDWFLGPHPWARWRIHEMELTAHDDGSLLIEVSSDHELPWPKLMTRGVLDEGGVAVREFRLRVISAHRETGEEGVMAIIRAMPDKYRKYIPAGTWADVIRSL